MPANLSAYYLNELRTAKALPWYRSDAFFMALLAASVALFFGAGLSLRRLPMTAKMQDYMVRKIKVSFALDETPKPKTEKKAIDLTHKPALGGNKDIVYKQAETGAPVRAVYGLRRVFATGLGAGGSGSGESAIVSKIGNTLDKDFDTLTAKKEDLKGSLVSVTTVTAMPVIKEGAKPEYTEEMKKNKVTGTISGKLLIDIDGTVKDVVILNDLGYGSREAALAAFKKLTFTPAMQGTTPVAVWIIMKFKFVLQE
jgi:hypothetical protein